MPRVILVDDEPSARRGLRRLLAPFDDIEIVEEASGVDTARKAIAEHNPDAVFLDVELTTGKGFDIAHELPENTFVIIVSAYDLYAIEAFDIAAIDFLLKPVDPDRLETAIERLRDRINTKIENTFREKSLSLNNDIKKIQLKLTSQSNIVSPDAISFLQAEGDYTRVYLETDQNHLIGKLLRKFEPELPSPPFCRLGRSLIVNKNHIKKAEWMPGGRSRLHFGCPNQIVDLGRSGTKRLRDLLMSASDN